MKWLQGERANRSRPVGLRRSDALHDALVEAKYNLTWLIFGTEPDTKLHTLASHARSGNPRHLTSPRSGVSHVSAKMVAKMPAFSIRGLRSSGWRCTSGKKPNKKIHGTCSILAECDSIRETGNDVS